VKKQQISGGFSAKFFRYPLRTAKQQSSASCDQPFSQLVREIAAGKIGIFSFDRSFKAA